MGSVPEDFRMFRYLDHLVGNWRVDAVTCGTAVGIAPIPADLTTNRHTSTAQGPIEPTAGSDPRGVMAVSPIYLESLNLYGLMARRNRLFLDAIDFKPLRIGPVERFRRWFCKATIRRNTKALKISANLHKPVPARALSLHSAKQTVKLARDVAADNLKRTAALHAVAPLARHNAQ
jgi:hypothetical protein